MKSRVGRIQRGVKSSMQRRHKTTDILAELKNWIFLSKKIIITKFVERWSLQNFEKWLQRLFFLANSDKEKEQKRWLAQWEMKILWIFAANQQSRSKNHRLQFSGLLPNWFDPFSELGDLFDHEHHLRCSSVAGCNFLITAYRSYAMSASCCWHLISTNNWTPLQIVVMV